MVTNKFSLMPYSCEGGNFNWDKSWTPLMDEDDVDRINKRVYLFALHEILDKVNGNGMQKRDVFCKLRGKIRAIDGITGTRIDMESYNKTKEIIDYALEKRIISDMKNIYLGEVYILNSKL